MATSHVDGSVKIYKFNNFEELNSKHKDSRPDVTFKDHFYSANQVTFANNNKGMDGLDLPAPCVGGHQPWMLTCSDDTLIHMYDLEKF